MKYTFKKALHFLLVMALIQACVFNVYAEDSCSHDSSSPISEVYSYTDSIDDPAHGCYRIISYQVYHCDDCNDNYVVEDTETVSHTPEGTLDDLGDGTFHEYIWCSECGYVLSDKIIQGYSLRP